MNPGREVRGVLHHDTGVDANAVFNLFSQAFTKIMDNITSTDLNAEHPRYGYSVDIPKMIQYLPLPESVLTDEKVVAKIESWREFFTAAGAADISDEPVRVELGRFGFEKVTAPSFATWNITSKISGGKKISQDDVLTAVGSFFARRCNTDVVLCSVRGIDTEWDTHAGAPLLLQVEDGPTDVSVTGVKLTHAPETAKELPILSLFQCMCRDPNQSHRFVIDLSGVNTEFVVPEGIDGVVQISKSDFKSGAIAWRSKNFDPSHFNAPSDVAAAFEEWFASILEGTRPQDLSPYSKAQQKHLTDLLIKSEHEFDLPSMRIEEIIFSRLHDMPDAARTDSSKTAVVGPGKDDRWSYGQLGAYAVAVAKQIKHTPPGLRFAVLVDRSPQLLGTLLGILLAGRSYAPISKLWPLSRIQKMVQLCKGGLITSRTYMSVAEHRHIWDHVISIYYTDDIKVGDAESWRGWKNIASKPSDEAYLLFTSGTSGDPKAVATSHKSALSHLVYLASRLTPDDVQLQVTDVTWVEEK